jgi:hypothetical protein
MDFSDCLMLLAVSIIPLGVLEVVKCVRNLRRDGTSVREEFQAKPIV